MSKWALVLSGGGSKGVVHVGAIMALEELGVKPDLIVGCSMGAIIGGLYCSGMSTSEIAHELEHRFNISDHMNLQYMEQPDTRLWKLLHNPQCCLDMMQNFGLDKPDSIESLFVELTRDRLFNECSPLLIINAVDLLTSKLVELTNGSVAKAMRASMAIPGVFSPVQMNGMVLVDGGILDNMPVELAWQQDVDVVVAVNVGKPLKPEHLGSAMSILASAVWTAGRKPARYGTDKPSLEIKADVQVDETDFGSIGPYIEAGKKAVLSHAEDLLHIVGQ